MDIGFLNPDSEEKLLFARICDLCDKAESYGAHFTRFLNLREQEIAKIAVSGFEVSALFEGGFSESERVMLGVFNPYCDEGEKDFPLSLVKLTYSKKVIITHRDVLGALMGLGIERNSVGDILFCEDGCVFSVINSVRDMVLSSLTSVNKFPVEANLSSEGRSLKPKVEEKTSVVSSMRLDAVVSALTGKSRSVSCELIKKQKIFVNDKKCEKTDFEVKPGEVISVRGFGKFRISKELFATSKGRIRMNFSKYI